MEEFALTQPLAYKILSSSIKENRLTNAYLIEDNGTNQGMSIACSFCSSILNEEIELTANALIVEPDGVWIKREQVDEIKQKFSTKAIIGENKVYIINCAENLNPSATNALLKFLEEPDEHIYAILVTKNISQVYETIKSRCLLVPLRKFQDRASDVVSKIADEILNTDVILDLDKATEIVEFVDYLERNKFKTILHLKKMTKSFKLEKNEMLVFFNVILLFYKDVLEYKTTGKIEIFEQYKNQVIKISGMNRINQIILKTKLLIEVLDDLKYNVNIQMEFDKFLMRMEEI